MLKSLSWWARLESREEKSESLEAWLEAARTLVVPLRRCTLFL